MRSIKNLTRHFEFGNLAIAAAVAVSVALAVSSTGRANPNREINPQSTRAMEYRSIAELNHDASLIAVIEPTNGLVGATQFPTAKLPTSNFRVLKSNDNGIVGKTLSIVLPSESDLSSSLRLRKTLVWLIPLTFGNGVNENTWVVVGDGAGMFSARGGQASGDTRYYREDRSSTKLPDNVQWFGAKSERLDRPNR